MTHPLLFPIIDVLPVNILTHCSGKDISTLKTLCQVFRERAKHVSYSILAINPSQAFISEKILRSVFGVNRSVKKLTQLGVIKKYQRRKPDGTYYLNVYKLGDAFMNVLNNMRNKWKPKQKPPIAQKCNGIDFKDGEDIERENFQEFMKEIRGMGLFRRGT